MSSSAATDSTRRESHKPENSLPGISVVTSNLSYYVPQRSRAQKVVPCFFSDRAVEVGPTGKPCENGEIELLDSINFVARPGQFVAIIGPSGSGKTTLLNVIAQRVRRGRIEGQVLFNARLLPAERIHSVLALVMASDKAHAYLTVEETLLYDAHLKLPYMTLDEQKERVESVLADVGLTHVRNNRVGGTITKGLSTGEIRRLSIAVELLSNPPILLLDEPTSTLDAALAFEIICVLKRLAMSGRTVICTIHQPRSSVFALFDRLVVMARGRIVYQGDAMSAQSYFESKGFEFPKNCNPAEVFLDICSTTTLRLLDKNKKNELTADEISALGEQFITTPEGDTVLADIEREREIEHYDGELGSDTSKYTARRWCSELFGILRRTFWNTCRNPVAFGVIVITQALMGLCLGAIFFQQSKNYMPDTIPPPIDSPDSALSSFLSGPFFKAFEDGIDGQGSHPLMDALVDGVDGVGSRPFDDLINNETLLTRFHGMLHCAYDSFQLARVYPEADFQYLEPMWTTPTPTGTTTTTQAPTGTTPAWEQDFGPADPPHIVSDIMKALQLVDFAVGKFDWYGTYATCTTDPANSFAKVLKLKDSGISFYACLLCYPDTHALLARLVSCLGWVPLPRLESVFSLACPYTTIAGSGTRRMLSSSPTEVSSHDHAIAMIKTLTKLNSITDEDVELLKNLEREEFLQDLDGSIPRRLGGGHKPNVTTMLPDIAWEAFDYLSELSSSMKSCGHDFCMDLNTMSQNQSSPVNLALNEMAEYGMVLNTVLNGCGILFFAIAAVGFASYDALVAFPQERVLFNREVANGMYKVSSYFIGKNLADMTFQLLPAFCLTTLYYLMAGCGYLQPTSRYFGFIGVCMLMSWCSYGFAYMISAFAARMEVAVIVAPLVLVVLISMAGFFVRDDALPNWLFWLKYLSLYRWGFFALASDQYPPEEMYGGLPNDVTLAVAGISETRCWVNCMWLIILALGFRLLGYIGLRFTNRFIGLES